MRISKQTLIEAIDAAIANEVRLIDEYESAHERMSEAHNKSWGRESLPRWLALRDHITKTVRAGQHITEDDVRRIMTDERYASLPYYKPFNLSSFTLEGKSYSKVVRRYELPALRKALEAIEEDHVTPSALASIGFKDLSWLFRKALGEW